MIQEKKSIKYLLAMMVILGVVFWKGMSADAATTYSLEDGEYKYISVYQEDTGVITPTSEKEITKWEYSTDASSVLSIASDGTFLANAPGTALVEVMGYSTEGITLFHAYCSFTVSVKPVDMANVTLTQSAVTAHLVENGYGTYDSDTMKISFKTSEVLDTNNANVTMSYASSKAGMNIKCTLHNSKLIVTCYDKGSTTLTITVNNKVFLLKVKAYKVSINATSVLLSTGKTKQLTISGTSEKVSWYTSNSKIATVTSKGLVKGLVTGTAIIKAKIGNDRLGSAVAVTSSNRKSAINRAVSIAKKSIYSQPKRMLVGYYDCSSLVWRSYSKYGMYFGTKTYAPVAADIAKWCAINGKVVSKSIKGSEIQSRKYRAGDLLFKTGAKNGRYKGIYHVEIFAGYNLVRFDANAKAVVEPLWANRTRGYECNGSLLERP